MLWWGISRAPSHTLGLIMDLNSADNQRLLAALDDYVTNHRHPARRPFLMHDPCTMSSEGIKGSWEGTDPSWKAGCYAIFSQEGSLLYIGKASNSKSVGDRLVRFRYKASAWAEKPAYVRIIEVVESFEAPSLEEFLIGRLQPRNNKHGSRREPVVFKA